MQQQQQNKTTDFADKNIYRLILKILQPFIQDLLSIIRESVEYFLRSENNCIDSACPELLKNLNEMLYRIRNNNRT